MPRSMSIDSCYPSFIVEGRSVSLVMSSSRRSSRSPLSSPVLDYARQTQTEAMESRTAKRIAELIEIDQAASASVRVLSDNVGSIKKRSPLAGYEDRKTRQMGQSSSLNAVSSSPAIGSSRKFTSSMVKRNITQRRSKGRSSDDGSTAPDPSVLSRRSRSRSKDRRYSLAANESLMEEFDPQIAASKTLGDHSRDSPTAESTRASSHPKPFLNQNLMAQGAKLQEDLLERAKNKLDRTSSNVSQLEGMLRNDAVGFSAKRMHPSFAPAPAHVDNWGKDSVSSSDSNDDEDDELGAFLSKHMLPSEDSIFNKKNIPLMESDPDLHIRLTQLWDYRRNVSTAMNLALDDDDTSHYVTYQGLFAQTNKEMHTVLRKGLKDYYYGSSSKSTEAIPHDEVDKTMPREEAPVSPGGLGSFPNPRTPTLSTAYPAGNDSRWRDVDSLPMMDSPSRKQLKQSYKETENGFEICLSYQGVLSPRVVNANLPTRTLHRMAQIYLQDDFGFLLSSDNDLKLEFDGRQLTRMGVLEDIPIWAGAIVSVIYPIKPPVSGESPSIPSARVGPGEDRVGPSSFSELFPQNPAHGHHGPPSSRDPDLLRPDRQTDRSVSDQSGDELYDGVAVNSLDPRSYDKIRQNFKCPKFTGNARDWKVWDKGFWRYLSIWELEYVLDPSFFDVIPLSADRRRDNKLVYFIIEDSVQNSTLATSYIKQASIGNGFEAYYTLHDGYVFAGSTTATLLLNELSNFRFLPDESPTELCLRLEELFQELRDLPADAAVTFVDTQKVGYLVNALRHEKEWDYVCSAITSAQIKGGYTFREACNELKFRCEASRANDLMDKPVKGRRVKGYVSKPLGEGDAESETMQVAESVLGLISSMTKKLNVDALPGRDKKVRPPRPMHPCLAEGCSEQTSFPLCPLHYHPMLSGKVTSVKLKNGYGDATYDGSSQIVIYPGKVPENRLSKKQIAARSTTPVVSAKVAGLKQ